MTNAVYDVCAVGNAIVDIIASCGDEFLREQSISKGTMTLVDAARAERLYEIIGPATETSGGSAANTVAGIASLGGIPAFIGKVRNDQLGSIFRHDMTASGARFATPPLTDGPPTARCIILVTPDAQRSMNTYLGASVELTEADIDPDTVQGAEVTYLEGYLFDKPSAQAAFYTAARLARSAHRRVALSLSDPFCVERHQAAFRDLVAGQVDVLLANEHELMALYDAPDFDAAMSMARQDCQLVVGTRSAKGAVIVAEDDILHVSADPVSKVVDTTGAGDLFAAGFLYGITHGYTLLHAGRLGAMAAAEVISHFGPRPQVSLNEMAASKGLIVKTFLP